MDDIERRAMRMGRVRFLIEAEVGLAIAIAILTGLLRPYTPLADR